MSFLKVADGTNLYYKESGFGKPIIFVHGWCINCDSWEYIMEELADSGYQCIAYDQRAELTKIRIPLLMLHGDQDTNAPIPLTAAVTHQLLVNSELKIIEKGTHGMYVVRAGELTKEIFEFIAG